MKKLILVLFIMATLSCTSQKFEAKRVNNFEINNLIGNITAFKTYTLTDNIVKIVIIKNLAGSAKNKESGEVSNNMYISKCEFGELPICKLQLLEDLININIEKVYEDKTNIKIDITSGNYNQRKSNTILISMP
ncbi:hypothetical protein [Flavobacterium caseinilyticum]|uniref:Uncharacterized protein n=1 Tax=Flavobacterium caseinilyticum TaxID=2541732 RepID=A0A4R5ASZ0_9FLAO|nr:hypothetical protein [Flavobacterium caseinilyticum]TDD74949.1 hypothetical protein E0F89_13660 [Flavobacterium caseinilyticum]